MHFVEKCHNEPNCNHCWLPKADFFVSSTILMPSPMSLRPLFVEERCIIVPLPKLNFQSGLEFLLNFLILLIKLSQKCFETIKFKIWSIYGVTNFLFLCDAVWWYMSVRPYLFNFFFIFCNLFNSFYRSVFINYFNFIFLQLTKKILWEKTL